MEGKDPLVAKRIVNYTFRELAEQYLSWAERQRAFQTSKKYLVPQLRQFFGSCPLQSISTRLVEEYQTKLLAAGKKPAPANRHLATLKHMFTKGVE
jgi:hypothetical protein